jgi:hypothetical protein
MMALNWLHVAVPSNEMMPQSKTSLANGTLRQHSSPFLKYHQPCKRRLGVVVLTRSSHPTNPQATQTRRTTPR